MSIEAMKQALNALEFNLPVIEDFGSKEQLTDCHRAITKLYAELAKPEQTEALRVADAVELNVATKTDRLFAATELRRLHEENKMLKKCLFQMQNAAIELAKPEQEPVACVCKEITTLGVVHRLNGPCFHYTAPPQREWVGLNWDDIPDVFVGDIAFMQGAKWALAKLKEKNGG